VAKSPCNSIGSERLWDFIMLCYAVIVALLPKSPRLILRWALSTSAGVFLDALHGLEWSGDFQHRVRTFQTIPVRICCWCKKEVEEYLVPGKPARWWRSRWTRLQNIIIGLLCQWQIATKDGDCWWTAFFCT